MEDRKMPTPLEEYLASRAEYFERIRTAPLLQYYTDAEGKPAERYVPRQDGRPETPVLTAGRLLEELTRLVQRHGPDVPVFSLAETEWVTHVYWEPFEYEDG